MHALERHHLDPPPPPRLVLLHGGRPPSAPAADAPLPDWLDLVLCVLAPSLTAGLVVSLYRLGAWLL